MPQSDFDEIKTLLRADPPDIPEIQGILIT